MTETSKEVSQAVNLPEEAIASSVWLREEAVRRGWFRLEYAILALLAALFLVNLVAYFAFDVNLDSLKQWGYFGIFLIALIGSASVALPLPGTALVVGASQVVNDVLGIPFWLLVGVTAAAGVC